MDVVVGLRGEFADRPPDSRGGAGDHELADVVAVDRSPDAAAVARANAERLALTVEIFEGDLLAPVAARAPFTLIVSNPPYIASDEIARLAPEVKKEPRLALDGGRDGLDVIRRLIKDAPPLLSPSGALAIEIGAGQAAAVIALFAADGRYAAATATADLGAIERVIAARLK